MKIYIVTFNFTHNLGATLQEYALFKYLHNLGKDVYVVDYRPESMKKRRYWSRGLNVGNLIKKLYLLPRYLRKVLAFNKFSIRFIRLTSRCNNVIDIEKLPDAGLYICGSDQIWNPDITGGFDSGYLLNFRTNVKKIAYAASYGKDYCNDEDVDTILRLTKEYNAISVRESNLKDRLEEKGGKDISHVLDPVFLLSKDDYEKIEKKPNIKGYVLIYTMAKDKRCVEIAKTIGEIYNLKTVYINLLRNTYNVSKAISQISPEEFIGWVNHADYVVTNSFHGTAMSILLGKQFYCTPLQERGSRIVSILAKLGLESRIITEIDNRTINDIDYDKVNKALEKEIKVSKEFLERAIIDI